MGIAQFSQQSLAQRYYLDDSNKSYPPNTTSVPSIAHHKYPRILQHDTIGNPSAQQISKYHFVDAFGHAFDLVEKVQAISPDTMFLRHIQARAYTGYTTNNPCYVTMGVAFAGTGPISQGGPSADGCDMFAGHFLYKAGTTLRQSVNRSTLTLPVADASRVAPGQYVVIYDAPAGSFNNAEHVRVKSRDLSNNTLTLANRGYKSAASAHGANSIVAQHVLGQSSDARHWAFNMSIVSPRDGAGRTFGQFYANWLQKNYRKWKDGQTTSANVAGLIFDTDFYFDLAASASDSNNDLVRDDGISNQGVNWLGEGLDDFYRRLSNRLPNHYIVTGTHDARGFEYTHGNQMENWLDYGNGDFTPVPAYKEIDSLFSMYLFNMGESLGPNPLLHNLTKTPTMQYPGKANPAPNSNAPARLGLALTLMDNGYFGVHSAHTPDGWWDEYAVDVDPDSPNYGEAIASFDESKVRAHRGWLGEPLGPFERIYDNAAFAPNQSLINNGTFDSNISSWVGKNVNISHRTSGQFDGTGALRASPMISYGSNPGAAKVRSSFLSLTRGQEYTIAFSARASDYREIRVVLGGYSQRLHVGPNWRRYVLSFEQASNQSSAELAFQLGRESTEIWFDSVYVFKGNVDVFRRDFDNGIVIANPTARSRTIDLGEPFLKIRGTQDSVNNGAEVTSVTLPPYDGLLLVRPKNSSGGGSGGGGSGGGGSGGSGSGTARFGDFVWNDLNGDGVQDGGEGGFGGVSVQLLTCDGTVLDTTQSSASGAYSFENLAAGSYQLKFIPPSGAELSPMGATTWDRDSNADPETGLTRCKTISSTQAVGGFDAGIIGGGGGGGSAQFGDFVWNDLDGDGVQDGGEGGFGGVTVQLLTCEGTRLRTTQSSSSGAYSFDNLGAGSYQLRFIPPVGSKLSPQGATTWDRDSNADPSTGLTRCKTISNSQVVNGFDAGITN